MKEIVIQQFMLPEYKCLFEDPKIQAVLPVYISKAIRECFSDPAVNIVTITWGGGISCTFFGRRKDEVLKTAEEFFDTPPLTSGMQSMALRRTAHNIDEGVIDMRGIGE